MQALGLIDQAAIVIGAAICGPQGNGLVEIVECLIEMTRLTIDIATADIGGVILRIKLG